MKKNKDCFDEWMTGGWPPKREQQTTLHFSLKEMKVFGLLAGSLRSFINQPTIQQKDKWAAKQMKCLSFEERASLLFVGYAANAPQQLLSLLHQRQLFVFAEERRKRVGCSASPPAALSLLHFINPQQFHQFFLQLLLISSVQLAHLLRPASRAVFIQLISLISFHQLLFTAPT